MARVRLLDNLCAAEVVASVEHYVAELVREANRDREVEALNVVEVYTFAVTAYRSLLRAVHLESRLNTELNCEALVEIYVGEDRHVDVVELQCLVDL